MRGSIRGSDSLRRKLAELDASLRGRMLEQAVVAGALLVQNDAKQRAPYVTGTLRRSIHIGGHEQLAGDVVSSSPLPAPEISADAVRVYVGTNLEYAPLVEYGYGRRRPRPYLRPAIDVNGAAVRTEIAAALADLVRAAVR